MGSSGYTRQVKKILKKSGCAFHRQGAGDHENWYSPISNRVVTVDNKILSRHTANAVLKQAGLKKAF